MDFKEPEDSRSMLIVAMGARNIGVQFSHRRMKVISDDREYFTYVTRAGIYTLMPDDETGPPQLINYGISKCSPKDQFNRETGRKIALTRALQEGDTIFSRFQKHGNVKDFAASLEAKNNREIVWKAYFGRIPKKEENPTPAEVIDAIIIPEQKQLTTDIPEGTLLH